RRRLAVAVPLAATVWAYDLRLKDTWAGPAAMAAARGLDVLLGGGPGAAQAAAAIAVHTYGLTCLSRGEVGGASRVQVGIALAATTTAAAAAALPVRRWTFTGPSGAARLALAAAYAGLVGGAQVRAARNPDAGTVRAAVGAGILGLLPLQAAFAARRGRPVVAGALAAVHPLARLLARKVSPT
ncbi:MAG TPA: 4-hydroxybenzoate polyprenyltransferase, partial [Thermomonospora sp.]|nr:4-hydroxybenzoate polyprenyltransferase [Thermomonospora sp.]